MGIIQNCSRNCRRLVGGQAVEQISSDAGSIVFRKPSAEVFGGHLANQFVAIHLPSRRDS